jgi:osmotically-inducible protein OsmY
MTEERIKKDVVDQLYWDNRIDASQIMVSVKEGKVTLEGVVPTFMSRQIAEMDAFTVLGVISVENNLDVRHPEDVSLPTDQEVEANIRSLLHWSPDVEATEIEVSVASGHVTLEGSVDAYWKKVRAEELASTMAGISGITNRLSVVPSKSLTDKWIAEDIQSALERDASIDDENVEVKVENGNVTLSGQIYTSWAYRSLHEIVARTAGVVAVRNDLVLSV